MVAHPALHSGPVRTILLRDINHNHTRNNIQLLLHNPIIKRLVTSTNLAKAHTSLPIIQEHIRNASVTLSPCST